MRRTKLQRCHRYNTGFHAEFSGPIDIDLLIEARWIIPVEPAGVVLEHHAVAVNKGRIIACCHPTRRGSAMRPGSLRALGEHVLIPGLVNLHSHAAMNLLRGYADDQPLMRWLTEHIWPAEQRHVSHDFVRDGTLLACAEMLSGGITCFSDMYFFPDAAAEAALEVGMRAALGIVIIEFPSAWATDADQYLSKGLAARDRTDPIRCCISRSRRMRPTPCRTPHSNVCGRWQISSNCRSTCTSTKRGMKSNRASGNTASARSNDCGASA
jgi:hypothetical protein